MRIRKLEQLSGRKRGGKNERGTGGDNNTYTQKRVCGAYVSGLELQDSLYFSLNHDPYDRTACNRVHDITKRGFRLISR